jgi:hypothetical protein
MTMTITKTLMLAAFAAISLGAGSAMASDGGGATSDYWAQQYRIEASRLAAANVNHGTVSAQPGAVQFGGTDIARPVAPANTNLTAGGF